MDWDEANIAHIARHGVTPEEAEEVIQNDPIELLQERRNGELRMNHLGESDAGRVLVIVTTPRLLTHRVVTAFPADRTLRQFYESQKRQRDDFRSRDPGLQN